MLTDIFDFITPIPGYTHKTKSWEHNTTEMGWPPDYEYCYQKSIINPITQHSGIILAYGEIDNIEGKHLHILLDSDQNWLSLNHDGIKGVEIGKPGMERRHVLSNGDPRGMIMAPRMLDIDYITEIRIMPWEPYSMTYEFCYSQTWLTKEYAMDSECRSETKLIQDWIPQQKVRRAYEYDFGKELGKRRVLEFWSGNDLLWEIMAFAEGVGYIAYRQWSIQGNVIFPPQSGRTILWTIMDAPITKIDCYYGGRYWI